MKILIGYDGSASAKAAIGAALRMPWPEGTTARGVVARGGLAGIAGALREASRDGMLAHADEAERRLRGRWPDAEVAAPGQAPERALGAEARRWDADAIVLGWRGHGTFRRLLAGSVSRALAESAPCSVMVVRAPLRFDGAPRTFVAGYDGSANSRSAVRFLARLAPSPESRVHLVGALEPLYTPPLGRLPAQARRDVIAGIRRAEQARVRKALGRLSRAARYLRERGWRVRVEVARAAPLAALLDKVAAERADVLVVGARGTGGLARMMLGSVAAGALDRSPCPVVIAR